MRLKFLAVSAVAALALALGGAAHAQKKWEKVRIATEGAYAPWNFKNAAGKLDGFEVELAAELCKRMKVTCEVVEQDWDGIIPALTAGKYDAIMAGMNITDKRLETINFSAVYAAGPHGLAVLKSSPLAKLAGTGSNFSLTSQKADAEKAIAAMKEALKGKTIGVQVSTTNAAFIEKYFKGTVTIREYKTTEQHDLDLAAGRIDGAFAATSYWLDVMSKPAGKDMVVVGPTFQGDVLGRGVAVGLRKADPELKKMFDDAIASAVKDGTIKAMSTKWFKQDMSPK
jgi:octopine/nopaline transport system substrate-binding protein